MKELEGPSDTFLRKAADGEIEEVNKFTGEVVSSTRKNPINVGMFSREMVDIICGRIAEGENITRICAEKGMPSYATLCRWRRENEVVDNLIRDAIRDSGHVYGDKVLDAVEKEPLDTRDDIARARLKADIYKWKANVSDPANYSTGTRVDANVTSQTYQINSFIPDRNPRDVGGNEDD